MDLVDFIYILWKQLEGLPTIFGDARMCKSFNFVIKDRIEVLLLILATNFGLLYIDFLVFLFAFLLIMSI